MKDKYFIDTNIFVYMFDRDNPRKREIAIKTVKEALESHNGITNYQVIQEFCNVALRKFKTPLPANDCRQFLHEFLIPICSVFPGTDLYYSALEIGEKTQYSFFDSLIRASALSAGCSAIITEDMQHNRTIYGMKIINPFV